MSRNTVRLTREEREAIAALRKLAACWPASLTLFSWNGTLKVLKTGGGRTLDESVIFTTSEIRNDGGDPNGNDVIEY